VILFNPTKKEVSFICGGRTYVFRSKESKNLDDFVATHALERSHAPLVEQTPDYDKEVAFSDVVYADLKWKELVQLASARGVFTPGLKRPEVEKLLEDYDNR